MQIWCRFLGDAILVELVAIEDSGSFCQQDGVETENKRHSSLPDLVDGSEEIGECRTVDPHPVLVSMEWRPSQIPRGEHTYTVGLGSLFQLPWLMIR